MSPVLRRLALATGDPNGIGPEIALKALAQLGDADRQAFSPMLAILSARHETQYSRLFRS